MNTSVNQISSFMDSVEPAGSVMDLADMHRWVDDRKPSPFYISNMLARHTRPDTVKVLFLFYNTFLMTGLQVGPVNIEESPARKARAGEIGKTLRTDAQNAGLIAALCEVWDDGDRDRILNAWPGNKKPNYVQGADDGGLLQLTGAGLLTISSGYPMTRGLRHTFGERGSKTKDADYYSNKGVLLTEIDLGFGFSRLEVYSTHLFNGGVDKTPPDSERVGRQLKQVDELIAFVRQTHRSQNVALIVGDFNVPATYEYGYGELTNRMRKIDMTDMWVGRNDTNGYTSSFLGKNSKGKLRARKDICVADQSDNRYCDDQKSDALNFHTARIDYIFIQKPQPEHGITVDFTRPRRRPFLRAKYAAGFNEIEAMSDHLGLETTLVINLK